MSPALNNWDGLPQAKADEPLAGHAAWPKIGRPSISAHSITPSVGYTCAVLPGLMLHLGLKESPSLVRKEHSGGRGKTKKTFDGFLWLGEQDFPLPLVGRSAGGLSQRLRQARKLALSNGTIVLEPSTPPAVRLGAARALVEWTWATKPTC